MCYSTIISSEYVFFGAAYDYDDRNCKINKGIPAHGLPCAQREYERSAGDPGAGPGLRQGARLSAERAGKGTAGQQDPASGRTGHRHLQRLFADLAKQIETAARKRGYSIILFNSDYNPQNEQEYLDVVRRYRVDGVLAVPIRETSAEWKEYVKKLDVPIVTVTRRAEGLDSVYVDHAQAGAMVAEHLLKRDFRRFLFIGKDYDGKYVGFRQMLVQMGYGEQTANLVYQDDVQLKQALELWFRQASERGAVLPATTFTPCGCWTPCASWMFSSPKEVGVIGFDNTSTGRYLNPRLSSVSQPIAQMAQEAVTRLLDRIEHPGQWEVLDYPLSAELVLREST